VCTGGGEGAERGRDRQHSGAMIDLHGLTADLITTRVTRGVVGHSRGLQRDAKAGRLVRVARGAYLDSARWSTLPPSERFVYRIAAAQRTALRPVVFSHAAAAVIWGLPWWGAPPSVVDVTDSAVATSRTHRLTRVHAQPLADDEVVEHLGVRLTTVDRTCADVLFDHSRLDATVVVDAALRDTSTTVAQVAARLDGRPRARASVRARTTLEFCDARSGSPGESVSRVLIHGFGFPAPVLQQPWRDSFGFIGFTDMWWPDLGVVGEYDGNVKYLSDRWRKGRSPQQVVMDEKVREDRLRATPEVRGFARWGTDALRTPEKLRTTLLASGLRAT